MSINIGPPAIEELRPRILVIGVGGAGGNAIANMIQAQIEGVDFIVANTDAQALNSSIAENRIQLGPDITQGLGAGSRPEVGRAAAEETIEEIDRLLEGVHMVFIAAGMGGGTGTGAAPIIAKAARDKGVLTVGVVTKPFMFEGTRRMRSAETGIDELQKHVDTLIVIPNQNLFLVAKADTTFKEAFGLADEVLQQGVRSITDLMVMPGLINLDFADVRSVMGEMGKAMMGTGEGEGPNRALEAAERAIANPLLDGVSMQGAKGVIISIIGGDDMKLLEVDEAANHIRELVDQDANIIWGSAFNPDLQGKIRVSVVATGIEQSAEQAEIAARPVSFSGSRGPVRPGAAQPAQPVAATPTYSPAPASAYTPPAPPAAPAAAAPAAEPFDLGSDAELGEEDSAFDLGGAEELGGEDAGYGSAAPSPARPPVGLGAAQPAPAPQARRQDELNLQEEASEPAPAPGRRRTFLSEPAAAAPAPAAPAPAAPAPRPASTGSTLFERMSNLSRGAKPAATEDESEDDSGSISIPRFLGRQNNQ
ncbi:cell division protein FtsZ [Novosphingobium sp. 9U]|uniref:cell division protein FtsZ n=1 Tax=Novosphingobium sp. 9U TaxID=2653158 RepID=UPI0012F29FE0|nr:cell division protein FtsZ [Novosphingobium sp. 9U]VWX46543.1 Cell division protein FtsZ [Novosphingobium sp. 9U]